MNRSDFKINLEEYVGAGGEVVIPAGVTSIGDWAFYCCEYLTSVVIPKGVTRICDSVFRDCEGLIRVTVPVGVRVMF